MIHSLTKATLHDFLACCAVPPRSASTFTDKSLKNLLTSAPSISPRYSLIDGMAFHLSSFMMVIGNPNLSFHIWSLCWSICHQSAVWLHSLLHFASSFMTFATNFSVYSWLERVLSLFSCRLPLHPEATGSLVVSPNAFSWWTQGFPLLLFLTHSVTLSHKFTLRDTETWHLI